MTLDIKITLKYNFWRQNVVVLSLYTQRCYGRHNVSRKSVVVYRFYCMALFHSKTRDVIIIKSIHCSA